MRQIMVFKTCKWFLVKPSPCIQSVQVIKTHISTIIILLSVYSPVPLFFLFYLLIYASFFPNNVSLHSFIFFPTVLLLEFQILMTEFFGNRASPFYGVLQIVFGFKLLMLMISVKFLSILFPGRNRNKIRMRMQAFECFQVATYLWN